MTSVSDRELRSDPHQQPAYFQGGSLPRLAHLNSICNWRAITTLDGAVLLLSILTMRIHLNWMRQSRESAAMERGGGNLAAALAWKRLGSKIATNSQTLSALLLELTFGEDNRHIQVLLETCHLASQPSGTIHFSSSGQVPPMKDKSVLIFAKASL